MLAADSNTVLGVFAIVVSTNVPTYLNTGKIVAPLIAENVRPALVVKPAPPNCVGKIVLPNDVAAVAPTNVPPIIVSTVRQFFGIGTNQYYSTVIAIVWVSWMSR